jgi:hypothetical protein
MSKNLFKKFAVFAAAASLPILVAHPAQAVSLPAGVAAFTWVLNGVTQTIQAAISIISSINPQPVTGIVPPVTIDFQETSSQVQLTVTGGDFDVDSTQTFGISGTYWSATTAISQDSGFFFDKLGLSGSIKHNLGPHPGDGLGAAAQFTASWIPPFSPGATINLVTVHPTNQHIDVFAANLVGTTSGIGTDIGTWNFSSSATHYTGFCPVGLSINSDDQCSPVPVPAPLPLLGVGAAFGYSRKLRKRIKTSKSPDVMSAIG